MSFQRVYEHITWNKHCPQLAPKNTRAISEWIAAGYDTDKDIIPAINEALKHGGRTIFSFGYFTGFIRKKHEARIKEDAQPKEVTPQRRAEVAAWKRKRDMQYEKDFLDQYEQQNGRIEA
jgi:hypothetical protein